MATEVITVGPGQFTIGSDLALTSFSGQVTSLRLVPSVDVGDAIYVLDGGEVSGDRSESWSVEGTMLQDFGSTDSKTEWLFENRGQDMPFAYAPNSAKGKQITGTLTVEAIEIGGDVKTKPTSDFEFKLVGPPAIETLP
ncbi:major tail protein [Arthrobacter phage SerialPhiller]|nr:major tail protein [Arthrobacter phage Kels]WNO27591.1 major tail protein [Arthrobacter phage Arielagos]WNT45240.1 major tail protein [Arthrobacter phage SerialPhiller]